MSMDPEKLAAQRLHIESMRVEAERLEMANRLRAAELEAVRLGLRVECERGCGRPVGKMAHSGVCIQCRKTEWERKNRAGKRMRVVSGGAA